MLSYSDVMWKVNDEAAEILTAGSGTRASRRHAVLALKSSTRALSDSHESAVSFGYACGLLFAARELAQDSAYEAWYVDQELKRILGT